MSIGFSDKKKLIDSIRTLKRLEVEKLLRFFETSESEQTNEPETGTTDSIRQLGQDL